MKSPTWIVAAGIVLVGCQPDQSGTPVRVTIPRGAPVAVVADSLVARGVITSPRWFQFYVKVTGNARSLKAGVFDFQPGSSVRQAVGILVRGRTALARVVIQEGLMLSEITQVVSSVLRISPDSFREATRSPDLLSRVGARGPTLEGYLYPETYHVGLAISARALVEHMVSEFESHWLDPWDARLDSIGLTRDEAVTLASIIEGEVLDPLDRKYVSSVYHNRLNGGMRLEADPTVIYALGERRRLFFRDYRTRSPFNTYLHDGLPPGPIGQPSAASIEAALYPNRTGFLFFVAGPDGKHIFSRTYREHQGAIRQLRRGT